ncbi:MAG: hypothetical protein ACXWUG_22815 [Polyangiales bacterium]
MGGSQEDPGNVPVLAPVESSVHTSMGIGPDVPGAAPPASAPSPIDAEDSISEQLPPPRRGPDPRMLKIVLGVVGFLALIGIVGGIVAVVRKSSAPPKEEAPVTQYSTPSVSASASASEAPSSDPAPAPSALTKGFGWLTLNGPAGKVMVKGKVWGDSGQKLAVPCGHVWVGISIVNDKGKVEKTLTKPQSLFVKCGGETEATAKPKK